MHTSILLELGPLTSFLSGGFLPPLSLLVSSKRNRGGINFVGVENMGQPSSSEGNPPKVTGEEMRSKFNQPWLMYATSILIMGLVHDSQHTLNI